MDTLVYSYETSFQLWRAVRHLKATGALPKEVAETINDDDDKAQFVDNLRAISNLSNALADMIEKIETR